MDLSSVSEATITVPSADGSRTKVCRVRFGEGFEPGKLQQGRNTLTWPDSGGIPVADALRSHDVYVPSGRIAHLPPEHEALAGGGFHGQIGCDDGENALGIAHRDRAGDHPDLTAARIKRGVRPDARVRG